MIVRALSPEWKRIELLCTLVQNARQGQTISDEQMLQLAELQDVVIAARAGGLWKFLGGDDFSQMELDILAVTAAPEVSYAASFSYSSLGQETYGHDPSLRLVQALLSIQPEDQNELLAALRPGSKLVKEGLINVEQRMQRTSIKCGRKLKSFLHGELHIDPPPGAREVVRNVNWDDLIVTPEVSARLNAYVGYVRNRSIVEGLWGGSRRGGPVALFSGASGTGKTMAASLIATALSMPLYRIDLGQLVSKYIGETEKNLNALFDNVNNSDAILLFDESDALFGKRGDVKDARDRYANMEVSHLLTRIESHKSPCILTTNLRSSIDIAFLRRFHIVAEFTFPDATQRLALWQKHLPPRAPRCANLDLQLAAQSVRFTGASIENAALHAAYLAADHGTAITMSHIADGVWNELLKDPTRSSRHDLGRLAAFLTGGQNDDRQDDTQAAA